MTIMENHGRQIRMYLYGFGFDYHVKNKTFVSTDQKYQFGRWHLQKENDGYVGWIDKATGKLSEPPLSGVASERFKRFQVPFEALLPLLAKHEEYAVKHNQRSYSENLYTLLDTPLIQDFLAGHKGELIINGIRFKPDGESVKLLSGNRLYHDIDLDNVPAINKQYQVLMNQQDLKVIEPALLGLYNTGQILMVQFPYLPALDPIGCGKRIGGSPTRLLAEFPIVPILKAYVTPLNQLTSEEIKAFQTTYYERGLVLQKQNNERKEFAEKNSRQKSDRRVKSKGKRL
ncbi:hypothetical protein SAMN05216464_113115 [Mucilaginibacter pineti]|uniref:Uncharacterized protein n=1 Tax=Mucilaginibacter pineti TaxID=1391627 RepID=A0A1G7IPN6_9SPHI|nr:hypothetical protein [Mucilaginibacter pineti]SDF14710.1 hypothetical protein SAMN05216464_113115 [Mucilaginibacter pineti]